MNKRVPAVLVLLLWGSLSPLAAQSSGSPSAHSAESTSVSPEQEAYKQALRHWQSAAYEKAERALVLLAEADYLPAQSFLTAAYLKGEALAQDYEQALHWCNRCALEGNEDCIYMLGSMYYYGMGLPKDWAKALEYYEFLAEQGHLQAQVNAGRILMMRAQPDYQAALYWLVPAAENENNPDAQALLGYAYRFGLGVEENKKKATRWYRQAARNGHSGAQRSLETEGISW